MTLETADELELVLTRLIDASPHVLFRCWTEPHLLKQWFVPKPWTIAEAEIDLRAGGANRIVMRSPEGVDMPNRGVYLEVVADRKLVFTDAYVAAWVPSEKPFMTVIITFEPEGDQTRYTARVRALDQDRPRCPRADGFPRGLGHLRRPARRAGPARFRASPGEAGPLQAAAQHGVGAQERPEEFAAVVLDHHDQQPLVEADPALVPPAFRVLSGNAGVEAADEAGVVDDARIGFQNMAERA